MNNIRVADFFSSRPMIVQRSIVVGFGLLLVFVLVFAVVIPLWTLDQNFEAAIELKNTQIIKYRQISASAKAEQVAWAGLERSLIGQDYIFADTQVSVAVARLESYLKETAERQNLIIVRLLPGSAIKQTQLWYLPVSLEISGSNQDLTAYFLDLENAAPLVRLERVEIVKENETSETLLAKVKLHGFYKSARQ